MVNQFYQKRINRVIDLIDHNPDRKFTLDELADEAAFSKFHFHRIFKSVTGETVNNYTKRTKMEKALRSLRNNRNRSLTEIALDLGYQSSANFSRDFKNYYNTPPSKIESLKVLTKEKLPAISSDAKVDFSGIKTLPVRDIVYIRTTEGYNPDKISEIFGRLYKFIQENDLMDSIKDFFGIGYDDPDYTPHDRCRYDACFSISDKALIPNNSPFNIGTLPGGKYAIFCFEGKSNEFAIAWDQIFSEWVVNSDYIPDNRPHFEHYLTSDKYDQGIFIANLCLPIKPI